MGQPEKKAEKIVINSTNTPHLRVGLKWEPSEIDHVKFLTASNSAGSAYFKIMTAGGFSAIRSPVGTFLKNLTASPQVANSFDASADTLDKIKKMGKQLREDFTAPSYNLDLLCFKYDKNKKLVGLISPYTLVPKNADKSQLAILHSGDDPDGVGVGFDEEILVNVGDVAPNVDTVFFVVSSEDYGFDKIKGGLAALIRTKDETQLLSNNLADGGDRQTLIFASMRRTGSDWTLENISDFIDIDADKTSPLDDTIDDILRNRYC